jgi:hypothetical protein
MTNIPGDGPPPQDPANDQYATAPQQPQPPQGYWEQQAQQQPQIQPQLQQQPPYGYPPQQGYLPQPVQYAPDHPKATTVLVLGILGVVLCQLIGPIAWSMGKKTVDEIDASRGGLGGRGAAQAGYILGIVGTVILGLSVVFLVIYFVIIVAIIGGGLATSSG